MCWVFQPIAIIQHAVLYLVIIYILFLFYRLDQETAAHNQADEELKRANRRLHEKESLVHSLTKERSDLDKRLKELEKQIADLAHQLDHAKAGIFKIQTALNTVDINLYVND